MIVTNTANTDSRAKENRNYKAPPSFYQLEQSSRNEDSVLQSYNGLVSPDNRNRQGQVLRSLRNATSKPCKAFSWSSIDESPYSWKR